MILLFSFKIKKHIRQNNNNKKKYKIYKYWCNWKKKKKFKGKMVYTEKRINQKNIIYISYVFCNCIILFETVRSYEKITSFLLPKKKNPFTQIIISLMYSTYISTTCEIVSTINIHRVIKRSKRIMQRLSYVTKTLMR